MLSVAGKRDEERDRVVKGRKNRGFLYARSALLERPLFHIIGGMHELRRKLLDRFPPGGRDR